jgi:DNA-binding MarR family transcriptional regulator
MQAEPIRGERWQAPPDEVVLLAVDRAERHKQVMRDEPGVSVGAIAEHLGMTRGSVASRRLNPVLRRLEARGSLRRYPLPGHSSPLWTLNETGRRTCHGLRDRAAELPESPQHIVWRQAMVRVTERMPIFRTEFGGALDQAIADLADGKRLPSLEWLEVGDALRDLARRVGFATYCAEEWAEPTDDAPDIDDPPMIARGRRNVRLWDAEEGGDV